jgi:hypothetical protein
MVWVREALIARVPKAGGNALCTGGGVVGLGGVEGGG